MKSIFILPVITLIATGFLISGLHGKIDRLAEVNEILSKRIEVTKSNSVSTWESPGRGRGDVPGKRIGWKEMLSLAGADPANRTGGDIGRAAAFEKRLLEMNREEMIGILDEIDNPYLTDAQRDILFAMVVMPFALKEPDLILTRFPDRLRDLTPNTVSWLSAAFGNWGAKDGPAAAEWLDKQVGSGVFMTKGLDERNPLLAIYEASLLDSLLGSHADLAELRIGKMPVSERRDILRRAAWGVEKSKQASLVELARRQLDEIDVRNVLGSSAAALAAATDGSGLSLVDEYLERIPTTEAERDELWRTSASSFLMRESEPSLEDVGTVRDWLDERSSESASQIIGDTLGDMANANSRTGYKTHAEVLLRFHAENGGDDLLLGFLNKATIYNNKEQARIIAEKISDPAKRAAALQRIR
ncbi:hypothetical protein [Haloferula sp.]|uniref:hypothetical protein n=1 Tax=Haloferula sp. TaxID=2497595 RepID=UPI003C77BF20